jgi:hypothetical protein
MPLSERWAERVLPNVMMELMRHESIGTTMRFYDGQNAQRTADAAWAAYESVQACQQSGEKIAPVNTSIYNGQISTIDSIPDNEKALARQGLVKAGE